MSLECTRQWLFLFGNRVFFDNSRASYWFRSNKPSKAGCPNFVNLALRFVYGEDSVPLKEKRVAGVQTLSGTGGLRVFGEVIHQFGHSHIYVVSRVLVTWHLSWVIAMYGCEKLY